MSCIAFYCRDAIGVFVPASWKVSGKPMSSLIAWLPTGIGGGRQRLDGSMKTTSGARWDPIGDSSRRYHWARVIASREACYKEALTGTQNNSKGTGICFFNEIRVLSRKVLLHYLRSAYVPSSLNFRNWFGSAIVHIESFVFEGVCEIKKNAENCRSNYRSYRHCDQNE